jgi:parallel beta-helix repeat protein
MKYKILLFLFALLMLSNAPAAGTHPSSSHPTLDGNGFQAAYTPHAPISINSDSDFETQGWPGNGSKANPYLIEGLNITASDRCIEIESTTAHYKIKNCLLSAPSPTNNPGMYLFLAPNGTIQDCVMEKHRSNIWLSSSNNCTFKNNTISEAGRNGIQVVQSNQCALINNTIANNSESAIKANGMSSFTIASNILENNGLVFAEGEIEYWNTHNISENTINGKELVYLKNLNNTEIDASNHGQTILVNCNNTTLANGTYNNASRGIQFAFCTNATIRNNTVRGCKSGIFQYESPESQVLNNTAYENEVGFYFSSSENCTVSINTATSNNRGMNIDLDYSTISHNIAINNSQDGFYIQSTDCNFTENEVKGNHKGLNLYYVETSSFRLNKVQSNSDSGFYLDRVLWSAFSNNTISNSVYGMYISRDVFQCSLQNNTFQQSGIYLADDSLSEWITSEDGNTVNGKSLGYFNGINDTQIDGSQYGQLLIVNSSFVEVQNGLYDNATEGIALLFSDNCTIRGSSSTNNSVNAYRLLQTEDCVFESNIAVNSVNHGFSIGSSTHVHLENNTAIENAHHGFYLSYSDFIIFHNNTADQNSDNGFHLASTQWNTMTDVTLNQNTASNNTNYGFFVEYASYCNLTNNLAIDNSESGFWIDNSANLNLTGNQATQNGIHGISIAETDNGYLRTNTVTSNSFSGFTLENCVEWILTNNSAVANQMGFSFDSVVNHSLEENSAISNLYFGFNFAKSSNLNLTENNATCNELTGFNFDDSDDCIVLNNTAIQNGVGIELDAASENNLLYRNNIGYNHHYNAFDDSLSTAWDNGTNGNCWSDYGGSGSYIVDGLANNIDNHPCFLDLYPPTLNQPQDVSYELGTVDNSITWEASDQGLDSYIIYRNGSVIDSGISEGANLTVNVDGLDLGVYNYTISINDTLDKISVDTVFVTVFDSTSPEIDRPEDIDYELGSTGNTITWNPADLVPESYRIYRNGSLVEDASWDGSTIEQSIDGLSLGTYNFTISVVDTSSNVVTDSVIVSVIDTTTPAIDPPDDVQYELGSTGNTINWNASDLDPSSYEIHVDGSIVLDSSWNGSNVEYGVDGLSLGSHSVMIVVHDSSGNYASDTVIISVTDTIAPTIDSPADVEYELGSTGNSISWVVSDLDSETYNIHRNGILITSESWDGSNIEYNVDGLSVGGYNFTLSVYDGTGNKASDTVTVDVIDTVVPIISSPEDIIYEVGTTGHSISWNVSDVGTVTYSVLRNGTALYNGSWNGSDIVVDVDSLAPGIYNFSLIVTDEGDNQERDSVLVSVLPETDTTTTTTTTTTTDTTSTTTTGTTPPPGPNPMMIALAAGVAIAGIALIVVLFIVPRMKLEGRL